MWLAAGAHFFEPQIVVLFGPIDVHRSLAHCLESALHANRADINVTQHSRDEQHGNDAVGHFGVLHGANIGTVERKYQQIAADRDCASAEHDDPIDELLATVETVGRRTVTSDDTSAALEPFDVDPVRDVAGDPHEEDQDDAERE